MIFTTASAYLGPGIGGGILAATLGIIIAILAGLIGIIWFPLKKLYKKIQDKKKKRKKLINHFLSILISIFLYEVYIRGNFFESFKIILSRTFLLIKLIKSNKKDEIKEKILFHFIKSIFLSSFKIFLLLIFITIFIFFLNFVSNTFINFVLSLLGFLELILLIFIYKIIRRKIATL
tara:strand:- start:295 stop:825 length:531 start_codon:yes stop_codon:yes gene_type:complete